MFVLIPQWKQSCTCCATSEDVLLLVCILKRQNVVQNVMAAFRKFNYKEESIKVDVIFILFHF